MALSAKKAQIDAILGQQLRDISASQLRELLLIIGPLLLLVIAAIWIALRFAEPAPPKRVAIATGGQSGGYHAIGQRYAAVFKRHGITLEVRTTRGSIENVARLTEADSATSVSAALMQGGITNSKEIAGVHSIGRMFPEPLWVFYRSDQTLDRLHQLKGRRLAVAPEGSGTHHLATKLLAPNGIDKDNTTLLPITGQQAVDALLAGSIDAVFLALAPEAPVIQTLLRAEGVRLMSFAQAEAYSRRFPYLQRIVLPQGTIDLVANIPSTDVVMVAPVASLLVREDLHPAVIGLFVEAAREVHAGGGLFHRVGDYPVATDPEFDMSAHAERYYKAGPSFLKRILPFWLATFIERMMVIAVPLAGALIPLIKIGPLIYKWRVRRRLLYWYGRLKALETTVAADPAANSLDEFRAEADRIDAAVATIPVPVGFADQYYSLRAAIDLVRQRLVGRAAMANSTMG